MPGICDSSVPPHVARARRLALRDQRIERRRTLRRDRQPLGDDERDAIVRKLVGDLGDGNVHDGAMERARNFP